MIVEITTKAGNRKKLTLDYEQWRELYKSGTWEGVELAKVEVEQLTGSEKAPHVIKF